MFKLQLLGSVLPDGKVSISFVCGPGMYQVQGTPAELLALSMAIKSVAEQASRKIISGQNEVIEPKS